MIFHISVVLILTAFAVLIAFLFVPSEVRTLSLGVQIAYPIVIAIISSVILVFGSRLTKINGKRSIFAVLLMILLSLFGYSLGMQIQSIDASLAALQIPLVLFLLFGYSGFILGFLKADEFNIGGVAGEKQKEASTMYKILDTSVIIDGRISDIAETGFLEGILVVPKFVLKELQQVADSSDPLKRSRGRRGLDILNNMKASKNAIIKIHDIDFPETKEVDSKLLKLAKEIDGLIITNDFNLNKVAEFQGVKVLNVNQLSNAVKPIVLPNEELKITIIKEGKDSKQGIAYLDDGTMIVVDNGRDKIGREVDVVVTSILQTPAGRMIFTQIADDNKR